MLDSLITSKTRIKLLLKFFLNTSAKAYLRGLADEFGESTNAIRLELNRMEEAGLLSSGEEGNRKLYWANLKHPFFEDIHRLVMKHSGIALIVDKVVSRIGDVDKAWVTGDFARGIDSDRIELVVEGSDIDRDYFTMLIQKVETLITRQIDYRIIGKEEEEIYLKGHKPVLLIWKNDNSR